MAESASSVLLGAEGSPGSDSPLSGVDPRLKIVSAVAWSVLLAGLGAIASALTALAGSLMLIILAKCPWRNLAGRLMTVNFFVLFMWFMLPFSFSSPGLVVASLGPLEITREGLELAALLTIKANAIVIAVIALLATSPLYILAAAGRGLYFPEKLINIFLLTVRYFHVMLSEYKRLRNAMRARGFKSGLNRNTINGLANLAGSLLVRSFDRAERVHKAMLCRGYTGRIWVNTDFSLKKKDAAFGLMILVLILLVGGCQWARIA
ncbi:cobalt ECF transporter T component CbiQ [Deltaproteobacteria bacterium OttesenSCG-928-K17]|nr:cobalt ECF transporter T component CbiQ [Deltaproteobacteria bacterium OttesenSCG-928-K17]